MEGCSGYVQETSSRGKNGRLAINVQVVGPLFVVAAQPIHTLLDRVRHAVFENGGAGLLAEFISATTRFAHERRLVEKRRLSSTLTLRADAGLLSHSHESP